MNKIKNYLLFFYEEYGYSENELLLKINELLPKIEAIDKYSQKLGLIFDFENTYHNIEYANNICYMKQNSGELNPTEFMIHNLAHYIVASPSRRELADFGLGPSPDSDNQDIESYTSTFISELEEKLTVFLSDQYYVNYFNLYKEVTQSTQNKYLGHNLKNLLLKMKVIDVNNNLTHQLRIDDNDELMYEKN